MVLTKARCSVLQACSLRSLKPVSVVSQAVQSNSHVGSPSYQPVFEPHVYALPRAVLLAKQNPPSRCMWLRFEQLALGYESDELGDLDEEADTTRCGHDLQQYGHLMDEFLAVNATHDHAHEGGQLYSAPGGQTAPLTAEQLEAAVAIAKVLASPYCLQTSALYGKQ